MKKLLFFPSSSNVNKIQYIKNDTDLHLPTCTHARTHAYINYFVYLIEREEIHCTIYNKYMVQFYHIIIITIVHYKGHITFSILECQKLFQMHVTNSKYTFLYVAWSIQSIFFFFLNQIYISIAEAANAIRISDNHVILGFSETSRKQNEN